MRRKTPQEKKKLSYERDRRNVYGEAPHAARKSIPLRKALRNRADRHYQNRQLSYVGPSLDEASADELESLIHHRVPQRWRKDRDAPLGEVVADKVEKRATLRENGGRQLSVYRWNVETGELIPVAVPPNKGMHPTADTPPVIFDNRSGRRVMPGVRHLLVWRGLKADAESTCTTSNSSLARFAIGANGGNSVSAYARF